MCALEVSTACCQYSCGRPLFPDDVRPNTFLAICLLYKILFKRTGVELTDDKLSDDGDGDGVCVCVCVCVRERERGFLLPCSLA